jgi:hypothetical protein
MMLRYTRSLLLMLALGALTVMTPLSAQNTSAQKVPRTADGKPDFTGTYQWPTYLAGAARGRSNATIFDSKNFAPLKPGGEPFFEPRTGDPKHDEPRDFCMPAGFPASVLSGNAMQLFQTKNYLVWVHEFQRNTRIIPLDGRPHREGLEPMYDGDPVGKWEGDTLVIDTTNFKRWALDDHHYTNGQEFRMHSDALHTIERLHWKSPTAVSYTITIDDPKVFTKPWSQEFEIIAKPEWEKDGLFEYVCQENNRCPGGKCGSN